VHAPCVFYSLVSSGLSYSQLAQLIERRTDFAPILHRRRRARKRAYASSPSIRIIPMLVSALVKGGGSEGGGRTGSGGGKIRGEDEPSLPIAVMGTGRLTPTDAGPAATGLSRTHRPPPWRPRPRAGSKAARGVAERRFLAASRAGRELRRIRRGSYAQIAP
jgi:hypothetical protein